MIPAAESVSSLRFGKFPSLDDFVTSETANAVAPTTEPGSTAKPPQQATGSRWYDKSPFRVIVLLGVFIAGAAYESFSLSALSNSDIWWHLRTGLWILQTHGIPRNGLFSQHANLPWIDASWGFDLLTAAAYRVLGLHGLPVLLMVFLVGVAAALFLLARCSRGNFWPAVFLVAIAECCIAPLQLRPALCSIILLSLELTLLFHAKRTGDVRALFWLPALFVAWVNLDQQFGYGLLALALFCAAEVSEYLFLRSEATWPQVGVHRVALDRLGVVLVASCVATFVSPYTYHLHEMVWRSATSSAVDRYLLDFHAMRFRQPQEYLLMLLVMAAFFALGRRRSSDFFSIALLAVCATISFRLQRDNWLVVVASVGVIGNALAKPQLEEVQATNRGISWTEKLATAGLVVILLAAFALRIPTRQEALMATVGRTFPVRASDYIRQNRLPQPLFNSYFWGGFLTWYLPECPVVIDGRLDLYGDAVNVPYFQLTLARAPLESNPDFAQAQAILLEANSPIAAALATLPDFRVAYRDDQAIVLVREH